MLILLLNFVKGMYIKIGKVQNVNIYIYKLYFIYIYLIIMLYIDNIMIFL